MIHRLRKESGKADRGERRHTDERGNKKEKLADNKEDFFLSEI